MTWYRRSPMCWPTVTTPPPYEVAVEQVLLTCLLRPCIPRDEWSVCEPRWPALTSEDAAAALRVLVPGTRWATIGERLHALLPVGVALPMRAPPASVGADSWAVDCGLLGADGSLLGIP